MPFSKEAAEAYPTPEERFLELLSLPSEEAANLQRRFHGTCQQALDTTINPHDRETLKLTAGILHWRLFSEPGDPLPPGLVQGRTKEGAQRILYDTTRGFGAACVKTALNKLNPAGLEEIQEEIVLFTAERFDQLYDVVRGTILTSQASHFIETLAEDKLPAQLDELPLTEPWRTTRAAQYDFLTRQKWAIEPGEPDHNLRDGQRRLEHATMLRPGEPETGLERLRSCFERQVRAELTKEYSYDSFTHFARDDDGERIVCTIQKPEGYYDELDTWIERAAATLALQLNETGPHVQALTAIWINSLIKHIVWPEKENSFRLLLNHAIDETWDEVRGRTASIRVFNRHDYSQGEWTVESIIHAGLATPTGGYVDLAQLNEDTSSDHERYHAPESLAEINEPRTPQPIGEVLGFTENARGQHAYRLLQSEPRRGSLPPLGGGEELTLRLFGGEFKYAQPYVPGYVLVSNSEDKYGFVLDEKGDPYAPADIVLTAEQRSRLAACYASIELYDLAQKVVAAPLTVQELISLLAKATHPITPAEALKMEPRLPTCVRVRSLEDYYELIRSGNLYVQCTGNSHFLQYSIDELFGKGKTSTMSGYPLMYRAISTGAAHQQTVFNYEGRAYILDATPFLREEKPDHEPLFGITPPPGRFRPPMSKATQQTGHSSTKEPAHPYEQTEPYEQKLAAIRQSLEMQLRNLLKTSDQDALYKKTNTLPVGDPLRATVETMLRAVYNDATQDEVERLHQYLIDYQAADEMQRRAMRVPSYEARTVQLLQKSVEQLLGLRRAISPTIPAQQKGENWNSRVEPKEGIK